LDRAFITTFAITYNKSSDERRSKKHGDPNMAAATLCGQPLEICELK
jgi:hypothetical protein